MFHIVQLSNVDEFFLGLNSKGRILVQKKKIVSGLYVHHIIKRKIWQFHVVVVQKSVMHVLSFSFGNLTLQDRRQCKSSLTSVSFVTLMELVNL